MSNILPHVVWPKCKFRMLVWNVLQAARWKCRGQKFDIWAPSHKFVGLYLRMQLLIYITCIDNRKNLLNSNVSPTCGYNYGELRPTSRWDLLASLGHPSKFQRVSCLGRITGVVGISQFAALNRGCHLHSAGRPLRWALAHILVQSDFLLFSQIYHSYENKSFFSIQIKPPIANCTKQLFIVAVIDYIGPTYSIIMHLSLFVWLKLFICFKLQLSIYYY